MRHPAEIQGTQLGAVPAEQPSGTPVRAVTLRAVALGLLVTLFVNVGSPCAEMFAFSNFSWSYLPEGGVAPFLLLLAVNAGLRRWAPPWALARGEMLTVFVMGIVANCTSLFLMFFHLSAIVSPHYFASPANRWDELLLPHLPETLIVSSKEAAVGFFEGLPDGAAIPWEAWLVPLARWLPFLLVLLFTTYALVVLFRKPWRDHERLSYPLMQLPLLLLEGRTGPAETPLARSIPFWIGVAIPLGGTILYVAQHVYPPLPAIPLDHIGCLRFGLLPVSPRAPGLYVYFWLNFLAVGVGYFVPSQLLLSIWVFYLARVLQELVLAVLGTGLGDGGMFTWGNASMAWQCGGAFFVLGLSLVYAARRHLRESLHAALKGSGHGDEPLSPRCAWGMLLFGSLFLAAWLWHFRMPLPVVLLFVPAMLLIYLAIARVVCDAGIFYFVPPLIAQNLCIFSFGSHFIGPAGMLSLGLSYAWHGDVQTVLPALAAQSFRLREPMRCRGSHFSAAVFLTVVVGILAATLTIIFLGYTTRAISWNTWVYKGWGPATYGQVLSQIQNPAGPSLPHLLWFGAGALVTWLLTWARLHFLWFALHPMGFAVVSSFTIGVAVWFACLVSWLLKVLILRWGGLGAYRRAAPAFIGLCVGHFLGRTVAVLCGTFFGVQLL